MFPSRALRAAQGHTPLIRFLGKRSVPSKSLASIGTTFSVLHQSRQIGRPYSRETVEDQDHTPAAHPASPTHELPTSFASYRAKAQQHGPLSGHKMSTNRPMAYGVIGGHSGSELGAVEAPKGTFFDRSELPERFKRLAWTESEMEAIQTGGASMWN